MRFARNVDGVSELEPCSAEPAESGSCYVSGTGMLCAIWRAVNVRNVEENMYHSASAEGRLCCDRFLFMAAQLQHSVVKASRSNHSQTEYQWRLAFTADAGRWPQR